VRPRAPVLGDGEPVLHVPVEVPAIGPTDEAFQEVPPSHGAKEFEHLLVIGKGQRPLLELGAPCSGGSPAKIRRHVLDDHGPHQLRVLRGQAPSVQTAHGVPDRDHRPGINPLYRRSGVGHEALRRPRATRLVWFVARRVQRPDLPETLKPPNVATPRTRATHEPVQQQDWSPFSAVVVQHERRRYPRIVAARGR